MKFVNHSCMTGTNIINLTALRCIATYLLSYSYRLLRGTVINPAAAANFIVTKISKNKNIIWILIWDKLLSHAYVYGHPIWDMHIGRLILYSTLVNYQLSSPIYYQFQFTRKPHSHTSDCTF